MKTKNNIPEETDKGIDPKVVVATGRFIAKNLYWIVPIVEEGIKLVKRAIKALKRDKDKKDK